MALEWPGAHGVIYREGLFDEEQQLVVSLHRHVKIVVAHQWGLVAGGLSPCTTA